MSRETLNLPALVSLLNHMRVKTLLIQEPAVRLSIGSGRRCSNDCVAHTTAEEFGSLRWMYAVANR